MTRRSLQRKLCRGMIRRYTAFSRAKTYLAQGFPLSWIADATGVHRNSVLLWAKILGYSAASGEKVRTQRINTLFRKFQRLPPGDREVLVSMIGATHLLGRRRA